MKIGLLGHRGSIGRRYAAILDYLRIPWIGYDPTDGSSCYGKVISEADKVLIATPTNTHYQLVLECINVKKPFLCEKPISKIQTEIEEIKMKAERAGITTNMVCNWKYALNGRLPIEYDYYNTGRDGIEWDCIQLIYLNPNIRILTKSPRWFCFVEGGGRLKYLEIEQSYITMIREWISGSDSLWNMNDALQATEAVLKRIGGNKNE